MKKMYMISFAALMEEGRFLRAYESLKEYYDIEIICPKSKIKYTGKCKINEINIKSTRFLFKYIEFSLKALKIMKKVKNTLIYGHNIFTCFILLHLIKRNTVIYDSYELYYPKSGKSFSYKDFILYILEKRIIINADLVICTNYQRALIMIGHYQLDKMPVIVDNISFEKKKMIKTKAKDIDSKKIKICYTGNLAFDRRILEFIKDISSYKKTNIQFDIWGKGIDQDKILKLIDMENYGFVEYKGSYDVNQLGKILENYEIGFISYPNEGMNNIFCSPNKLYDYTFNRVIPIAFYNYGLYQKIDKNKIGYCGNDILKGLDNIISNYQFYQNNLDAFLKDNSWDIYRKNLVAGIKYLNNKTSWKE